MIKQEFDDCQSALSNNTKRTTSTKLIKFNKNHEPYYQGYCKLQINRLSKFLYVEPINENFNDIVGFEASFKWRFITQKNILFVFGEFDSDDFALIFNDTKKCRKVYNAIFKERSKEYVHRELLFERFLHLFFKQSVKNDDSSILIKEIMDEWIEKHDGKEKEYYLKLSQKYRENPDADVKDVKEEDIDSSLRSNNRKRKFCETEFGRRKFSKNKNVTDNEQNFFGVSFDKKDTKAIDESRFKIVNFKYQSYLRQKLLIFTSSGKTHCYEYNYFSKKKVFYHCCKKNEKQFKAILDKDELGNDCIKVEKKPHMCSAIKYVQENYVEMKIIKKPDYEILENCDKLHKKILLLFNPNDRSQCYEYYWSSFLSKFQCCGCRYTNKDISAEIYHENTEKEYIRLINDQHVCEIRKYDPEKHQQSRQFVLLPNFEIQIKIRNGIERKTLIIFDKNDRNMCYSYFFCNTEKKFLCTGCITAEGKNVSAKLCQNDDGKNYIILSNFKHVCSLRSYVPQKDQSEINLRPPRIKFMEATETQKSKLFIFDSSDPKTCYVFGKKSKNKYQCRGCIQVVKNDEMEGKALKDVVTVDLCNDGNEYYVKMLDDEKHICEPRKYESDKYEARTLKPNSDYILFKEKRRNADSLTLAIYHPDNKNLCYKFHFHMRDNQFHCSACNNKKIHVTAKMYQNSDGSEYIVPNQKKHVCKPIKCSSIIRRDTVILKKSGLNFEKETNKKVDESRIVRLPHFELQRNRFGVPDRKLIIFYNDERSFCYNYRFKNSTNSFTCMMCDITARLNIDEENGDKHIIIGESKHKCEPVKYEAENKIIESPNYMIFNSDDESKPTKLVIFTSSTKEKCYEYVLDKCKRFFRCCACDVKRKKQVSAKLVNNDNGEECVQLSNIEHICTPKDFILEKFQVKIIPSSSFKLFPNKNGKLNGKLILFDSQKDDYVYEYANKHSNIFLCKQCGKKKHNVTAKLFDDKENGEPYLQLSSTQHICKSIKYDPENYKENERAFNNFVVHHSNSGVPDSRITVFDENDKTFGYQYSFQKSRKAFFCLGCNAMRKYTNAKLLIDDNGNYSIEFGKSEHHCTIKNLKEKCLIFDNFKFEENGNILNTKDSKEKGKYYKFKYDEKLDLFCCLKCKGKKKIITATICKYNNVEKEFVLLNDVHSCV